MTEEVWDKEALEMLLEVTKAVMPSPEAEKVIVICLVKAMLQAATDDLDTLTITMDRSGPEQLWNDSWAKIVVNGIPLIVEVRSPS